MRVPVVGLWVLAGALAAAEPGPGPAAANHPVLQQVGRGQVQWLDSQQVRTQDCYLLVNDEDLEDFTFSFEGRAPEGAGAEAVGIWATFRQFDRNHRYVVGLRGEPHADLYLARYSPDGQDRMLALQPVSAPAPGEWAAVKVAARGGRIKVFLNGTEMVSVEDPNAPFTAGKVGVGGGYHPSEYRNIRWIHGAGEFDEPTALPTFAEGAIKINFQPADHPAPEGWVMDAGEAYTPERGHGWTGNVGTRKRDRYHDVLDDTLVTIAHQATRGEFRLDLEPGDYLFTLGVGDSFPAALDLDYRPDAPPLRAVTAPDEFQRVHGQVSVGGEGLRLRFSRTAEGAGTSLNWLVVEPRERLSHADWARGAVVTEVSAEKETQRTKQRAGYRPITIASFHPGRSEVSLDGDWLFLPDYEFSKTEAPEAVLADDADWHLMHVPDLWSPYAAWLYGETFPDMPYDKGASDSYYEYRHARVEAFTFDWSKTRSAWYRKHVVLPAIPEGKRFELCFDAIAKVATVYVNGTRVGKNDGMFGDIRFDVTRHLQPGSNVIAVKVDQERQDIDHGDEVIDVAISVEVTRKMLSALPFGMTRQDARGIWQPTRLVITEAARVTDVFVKPRLDGAEVEVTVSNRGARPAALTPNLSVVSETDGSELVRLTGREATIFAGETRVVALRFSGVSPRPWSPDDPQLYTFRVGLHAGTNRVDAVSVVSGFKTFETRGNRLLLNGRPYALRGANHGPNMLAPNDRALADRFMRILKENNLNATRFHALPGGEPWMDAADRAGVLISYEGTWPWLMLRGPIPPQESIDLWMDEFQRMIRKHRNHPSLMLWTVNNEMKFHVFHAHAPTRTPEFDADTLARWQVVSRAVGMIRETDPTRPVVADSCYIRGAHWRLDTSPEELGIDDGDIDDKHAYNNWYNESFFNLLDKPLDHPSPDRPFIGQEISTGYYNADSGHPVRAYLFGHQTPQSWVGQWAYEHQDPSIFYTRHGMLTKELAEYYRREHRRDYAGSLMFGLVTWFKYPWDAKRIEPYPVITDGLRNAMAPVLVSARLTGRHLFAGDSFTVPVSMVNDAEDGASIGPGRLRWRFAVEGVPLSEGEVDTRPVGYYANETVNVDLTPPVNLPSGRLDAELRFDLVIGGTTVSSNHYAVILGERAWAVEPAQAVAGTVYVLHPTPEVASLLRALGLKTAERVDLDGLRLGATDRLVVNGRLSETEGDALRAILRAGRGHVLWVRPRAQAPEFFPEQIRGYRRQNGEVVTMLVPESPVFNGIEIGDLAWMGGPSVERVPISSFGGYHVAWKDPGLTVLAEEMQAHGYLKNPVEKLASWVSPLVSIHPEGQAPVILSEMSVEAALTDPIALRLWANLLSAEFGGSDSLAGGDS